MTAPWHRASYERLLTETLPALLAARLGIERATRILARETLPAVDEAGWFALADGTRRVVVPRASEENLATATIRCVGEQLEGELAARLDGCEGDPPLAQWIDEFLTGQPHLDTINPLATIVHMRRIVIDGPLTGWSDSHVGRVCFLDTPDGPNASRVWTVALGATIADGRLVPGENLLGPAGAGIPFLEHSETARLRMGATHQRQWEPLDAPEPPLVATGYEVHHGGVNLRTALLFWGADTHEDGLLVSESAAKRLRAGGVPLRVGDKLSHRHGVHGTVTRIVPDDRLPRAADGAPVEICYTFFGLPSRMNYGQLFESAWSRVARAQGEPSTSPPFCGGGRDALRVALERHGLPESDHGWLYWGRVDVGRMGVAARLHWTPQTLGPQEYAHLRTLGCDALLGEFFGGVRWPEIEARLARLGIRPVRDQRGLGFAFTDTEDGLALAAPLPDPWSPERLLTRVPHDTSESFARLAAVNERAARTIAAGAPASLRERALADLGDALAAHRRSLLPRSAFAPVGDAPRSARAVLAPGGELALDQIGLPAPVWEHLGLEDAGEELILARGWLTLEPHCLVALRPVRLPGDELVIRIPPLLCGLLDTDFDGDHLAVYRPRTDAARAELATVTLAAHLRRNETLLDARGPLSLNRLHGALFGLASLSRSETGRALLTDALGEAPPEGLFTNERLGRWMRTRFAAGGAEALFPALDRLLALGFDACREAAPTMTPFFGEGLPRDTDDPALWSERVAAAMNADQLDPIGLSVRAGARGGLAHLARALGPWQAGERTVARGGLEGVSPAEAIVMAAGTHRSLRRWYDEGRLAPDPSFHPYGVGLLARAMRAENPGLVFTRACVTGERDPLTELDAALLLPPTRHEEANEERGA